MDEIEIRLLLLIEERARDRGENAFILEHDRRGENAFILEDDRLDNKDDSERERFLFVLPHLDDICSGEKALGVWTDFRLFCRGICGDRGDIGESTEGYAIAVLLYDLSRTECCKTERGEIMQCCKIERGVY